MAITSFDTDSVGLLSSEIESALAGVAEKHGIRIDLGKITYRPHQCTVTLEAATIGKDGHLLTREAEDFRMAAPFFGLTPEHLGKIFVDSHGIRFSLIGFNPKARKHRFIIADVTGKQYATSEEHVLRGFGVERPKASAPTPP